MEVKQEIKPERKVLIHMLQLFKHYPCLWDNNNVQYGNSCVRKQAMLVLLDTYKLIRNDADIKSLKKKIDNMRTSYRRERNKVMRNRHYIPNLWYYNHLTFLNEETLTQSHLSENEVESPVIKAEPYQTEESTFFRTDILSETEAFGQTIGLQLSELTPMQKIIAEKLISDVIYNARLENLSTITKLAELKNEYLKMEKI